MLMPDADSASRGLANILRGIMNGYQGNKCVTLSLGYKRQAIRDKIWD